MTIQWSTAETESSHSGIKALVYGAAGMGKTRLCATAPKPLIISAEAGLLTFRQLIRDNLLDPQTPVIVVTDIKSVEEAYNWIVSNAAGAGIATICLDSISEITEVCLQHEKAKSKDPRAAYGEMAGRVISLIKKFRDLKGFHVLVTAKETHRKDELTGATKAVAKTPGQQVGPDLPYIFDLVLYAHKGIDPNDGSTYFGLQTEATLMAEAKDRSGVLATVEYPDFSNIIRKIMATEGSTP